MWSLRKLKRYRGSVDLASSSERDGRVALFRSARALLQQRGFSSTSGRDIAELAGASYGLVSYHWPIGGTERLLVEAMASLRDEWVGQLTTDVDTWLGGPAGWFLAYARCHADSKFAEAWRRWGTPNERPRRLLAEMLPDADPIEVAARWVTFVHSRATYESTSGGVTASRVPPSWIASTVGEGMTERELLRFESVMASHARAAIRAAITPEPGRPDSGRTRRR